MSELFTLQCLHVRLAGRLINYVYGVDGGYLLKWGETLRKQAQADANAASGAGIKNSLHIIGLAVDFELFKDGQYLTACEDYSFMGQFWKQLDPRCCWGGDFASRDGDHFSITYQGVK